MARVLIDDITEELIRSDDEGGTVRLTLDGDTWELDLSTASERKLRELLSPYMTAGRHTPKPGTPKPGKTRDDSGTDPIAVREWARANGIEVSAHGRIKADVLNAYLKATAEQPAEPDQDLDVAPAPEAPVIDETAEPRPRPEQIDRAEELLDRGVTAARVAHETGMTVEQVRELRGGGA